MSSCSSFRFRGVEAKPARHAFELELAAVVECERRMPGHVLAQRGGNEHLVRCSNGADTRADAYVEPRALLVRDPARTRVRADPDLQPEPPDGLAHRAAEAEGARGIGEDGEKAVACGVHL